MFGHRIALRTTCGKRFIHGAMFPLESGFGLVNSPLTMLGIGLNQLHL